MHSLRSLFAAIALSVMIPASVCAMESASWDFRGGYVPGEWNVTSYDALQPEQGGLHIRLQQEGKISRTLDAPFPVQVIDITTQSTRASEALFLWRRRGDPAESFYQFPFTIDAGHSTATLSMLDYGVWDPRAVEVGIALPGGTDLLLEEIRFRHWSVGEQLQQMWTSFWKFDRVQPYSINFLWGPIVTRTPVATERLWNMQPPPRGWSVGRILLPVLAVWALAMWVWWLLAPLSRGRRVLGFPLHRTVFLLGFFVFWLGFDVRMGLETLSYARTDYETFMSKPVGERTFRNLYNFHDVVEQSLPQLQQSPRFAFLAPPNTPLTALVRYLAYPSVPAGTDEPVDNLATWLIFARPDIAVGSGGRLMFDGTPLSPPGTVLRDFGDGSLLFRVSR